MTDEEFLATARRYFTGPRGALPGEAWALGQKLLEMIDRAHDYMAETLPLLQDKAKEEGAYDQVAQGWREDGMRIARAEIQAWMVQWAEYRAAFNERAGEELRAALMHMNRLLLPLPSLSPPSAARKRQDELEACLRKLVSACRHDGYGGRSGYLSEAVREAERVLGEAVE